MTDLTRRHFLTLSAAAAAYSSLPLQAQLPTPGNLRLVFFTDTHNQPELSANEGTAKALTKIKSLKPDLCIQGGDHVMDITEVPRERSLLLLDQYQKTEHILDGIPIHHVLGNHDVFGRDPKSGISPSDPLYGKQAFEQRFHSKTYRSFDHQGYHFILLDAIGITPNREFDAILDSTQLAWLAADLAATPATMPIIVVSHVPLVSAAPQYAPPYKGNTNPALHSYLLGNAFQVLPLFEGKNVIAVLQGHTHLNEVVYWRNIPFITSGAICGNWWKGSILGTPEGFTVIELYRGTAHWHYETYGWQTVAPQPDSLRPIANPRIAPQPSHT
ncbi:metallophosphoesterase [Granulicella sp. dw_53]|uniref:metallophosphoesterase family protein n=1 Tax=Granulicella sp. dw_53 TaxID=2719792 RepID=UPI001BD5F316|nr:metallophosphoesterase [Granulicella sp. dw_53]